MRELVFIGGGGFFSELFEYIQSDIEKGNLQGVRLKGVVDDKELNTCQLEYLGSLSSYEIQKNDSFLITIGNPQARKNKYDYLVDQGAELFSYIHSSAIVSVSAQVGRGIIVCPNSIVNANAVLGDNTVLNVFCSLGHDSSLGCHSVLSPYCAINGEASVGSGCFFATRATVFPRAGLGDDIIIDAHSYAKGEVESGYMVTVRSDYKLVKNRLSRK